MTVSPEKELPGVKERLLSAALQLFRDRGYAATSVREIVEGAGVTKPALYYHFGSKEGLYLALMEETYASFQDVGAELLGMQGDARERVLRVCSGIIDAFERYLDVIRLIYAMYFGPPQGAPPFPHEKGFDLMVEAVASAVAAGVESGEFEGVEANRLAWVIVSIVNTVMEELLCHETPRIDREEMLKMVELVLDGVRKEKA